MCIRDRCIEPLGESFSDYEIVVKLSERLGLLEEYTGGKTIPELIKYGWETSRCSDLVSWEDLNEKGYYWYQRPMVGRTFPRVSTTSTRTPKSTRSRPRPAS